MVSVIKQFAEAARTKDVGLIGSLLADDVQLHGTVWKPFQGKEAVLAVFAMLVEVIEDADYVAEYEGPAGLVLQLRGKVGGRDFDTQRSWLPQQGDAHRGRRACPVRSVLNEDGAVAIPADPCCRTGVATGTDR